jgi:hypothetical protein
MGKGEIWVNSLSIGLHWPGYIARGNCSGLHLPIKYAKQIVDNLPENGKNPYNLLHNNHVSTQRSWDSIIVFGQVSYSSLVAEPKWELLGCVGRMGRWPYRNIIGEKNMKCAIWFYQKGTATLALKHGLHPQLLREHQCFKGWPISFYVFQVFCFSLVSLLVIWVFKLFIGHPWHICLT